MARIQLHLSKISYASQMGTTGSQTYKSDTRNTY
ncbi:hypothetical protein Slin_4606 [Spirosoma linguale DSM 74]|uniref:Uncharacterized protein n=1 Tax=Spirosoma linguale (strain ATCC 33905 / DSM 74 / LMG 10896 / Claus 1) TaxID=504472 RepID=D2QNP8_SPILD|nr:hypothetical protein Slin_4606 [Spirosoma linguale DSM 74]